VFRFLESNVMRTVQFLLVFALLASYAGAAEPKVSAILKPPEGKKFRCFDFSPDGKYLAVGTDQKTAELWQVAGMKQAQIINVPIEYVRSLDVSPDGKLLAMGGPGKILLWSVEDRKTIEVLEHSPDPRDIIYSLAFNPSGQLLASTGGHDLKLWDVTRTNVVATHSDSSGVFFAGSFSPDGKRIAACTFKEDEFRSRGSSLEIIPHHDHKVDVWDVATGKEIRTLTGHNKTDVITDVAFSPDGKWLASSSGDETIKIWDIGSGECKFTLQGHTEIIEDICFSPTGKTLASVSRDLSIKTWDTDSFELIDSFQYDRDEEFISQIGFSPGGRILAGCYSYSSGKAIIMWACDPDGRIVHDR